MAYAHELEPFYNVGIGDLLIWDYDFYNCSTEEYAQILGLPFDITEKLMKNEITLTDEIADHIENATGIKKYILFNIEQKYLERKKRESIKSRPIYTPANTQILKEM